MKSLKTNKYYVGQTSDLQRRFKEHNNGKSKYTGKGMPWALIYKEQCATRSKAFKREQQIKSYKGGAAFKKLLG